MPARILLSDDITDNIYNSIRAGVADLASKGKKVHLHGIVSSADQAGVTYQNMKRKKCLENGIEYTRTFLDDGVSRAELEGIIKSASDDADNTSVVIQLPLPGKIDPRDVLRYLKPNKDPDAFFYILSDHVKEKWPSVRPPTPQAMLALLDKTRVGLSEKTVVVVGQGFLVGYPLTKMLLERGIEPMTIDENTKLANQIMKTADIIFTGVGKPGIVAPNMLKPGVIIIDAGYSKVGDQITGDADPRCAEVASWITPPLGAVGPLTIAVLLMNALKLAENL